MEMIVSVYRAVAIAAATDQTELRSLYERAVSHGAANTLCTPEEERAYGTLRLLTLATLRLPDLYLYAHLLEALDEDPTIEPVRRSSPHSFPHAAGRASPPRLKLTRTSSGMRPARGSRGRWSVPAPSCAAIPNSYWLTRRGGPRSRSRARSRPPPARRCWCPSASPTDWRVCSCST